MATIQIAQSARLDIIEIFKFVSKQSYQNAVMLVKAIKKEVIILQSYPEISQIVKEINNPSFRELKLFKYRIIYVLQDDVVTIITIHHSARLLMNNPHIKDLIE